MKIIRDVPQGSDEWLQLRLGIPTASDFSKIVTSKGERSKTLTEYAFKLAADTLLTEQEDSYSNKDMQRGNELEPEAREMYQEYTFNNVEEVTFIHCGKFGYSPDGLIEDKGLLEIKCPNATTHTKYLYEDRLPTKYKAQCQGGLFCSNRDYIDFVSYHPNFKEDQKLFIKRVYRDEEFIKALGKGLMEVIELKEKYLKKIVKY